MPASRVVACSGASRAAALAAEVAARLSAELEAADAVVAVDGCESRCATRTLAARGEEAVSVLAGEDVDVAGLLARRRVRYVRPAPPPAGGEAKAAHSQDDYLRAVYALASPDDDCRAVTPVLAAHVARLLGVSRPSAGEALERLAAAGLVERGTGREVILTPAGTAAAERALRRRGVVERFLADVAGYAPEEARARADSVEDAFDDELVERLERRLGRRTPPRS